MCERSPNGVVASRQCYRVTTVIPPMFARTCVQLRMASKTHILCLHKVFRDAAFGQKTSTEPKGVP